MSLDSAKVFIEKMKSDEAFRNRVMTIKGVDERRQFMSSEGFDFTQDEHMQVSQELSDEQLDAVAGGQTIDEWLKLQFDNFEKSWNDFWHIK